MDQAPREQTAEAVRVELAKRRMTGREFGRRMGWRPSTTSRRLTGQYPFTIDELARAAEILGVPLVSLLPAERAA